MLSGLKTSPSPSIPLQPVSNTNTSETKLKSYIQEPEVTVHSPLSLNLIQNYIN
jgi:hypothetical protein